MPFAPSSPNWLLRFYRSSVRIARVARRRNTYGMLCSIAPPLGCLSLRRRRVPRFSVPGIPRSLGIPPALQLPRICCTTWLLPSCRCSTWAAPLASTAITLSRSSRSATRALCPALSSPRLGGWRRGAAASPTRMPRLCRCSTIGFGTNWPTPSMVPFFSRSAALPISSVSFRGRPSPTGWTSSASWSVRGRRCSSSLRACLWSSGCCSSAAAAGTGSCSPPGPTCQCHPSPERRSSTAGHSGRRDGTRRFALSGPRCQRAGGYHCVARPISSLRYQRRGRGRCQAASACPATSARCLARSGSTRGVCASAPSSSTSGCCSHCHSPSAVGRLVRPGDHGCCIRSACPLRH